MTLENLMTLLHTNPDRVEFQDVMAVIADGYAYTPTRFTNGLGDDLVVNDADHQAITALLNAVQANNDVPKANMFISGYTYDVTGEGSISSGDALNTINCITNGPAGGPPGCARNIDELDDI